MAVVAINQLLRFLPEVQHDLGAALLTEELLLGRLHDFVGMSWPILGIPTGC